MLIAQYPLLDVLAFLIPGIDEEAIVVLTSEMAVILDTPLGILNAAFFIVILIWILVDSLRESRRNGVVYVKHVPKRFAVFTTLTLFCNAVLSVFNFGFAFHQYKARKIVSYYSVFLAFTWVLATIVSGYSVKRLLRENKKWPLVLILWWFFATFLDSLLVSLKLAKNFKSLDLSFFLSEDNLVDFVSFPLLLLLCFNAIPAIWEREYSESEQVLLQKEVEEEDEEAFSNAGIWSKLTFQWLNPIFRRGQIQKLELSNIPSVPPSEAAENASSMLEDSLRKQKLETGSLTKAIAHSIWKSLTLNAVFAGKCHSSRIYIYICLKLFDS